MRTASQHPYFDAPPVALAHQGGDGHPPTRGLGNTMTAFRAAVELGYRYLETDVHTTRDGHLVVFHDDRLDRVTDGQGLIAQLPWGTVQSARVRGVEPIPELSEVLETFPGIRVNVDIKAPGAVGPLWRVIREHGAEDRVCVGSFSNRRLAAFRRLSGPRVATAAGVLGTAALRFAPDWVSTWLHSPAQALQVPASVSLWGLTRPVVTPQLLRTAHRLGKQVHVWTIDEAAEMERLLDLGVDGIVTDRIEVLRDVLVARGQWN
ncbi:MAG: glycerophosphodiester phosphodiesterase [Actinomycetota bacterium]|nr:glycerophosphodiester phosphodiesterase [Actinomycetota bacterium]